MTDAKPFTAEEIEERATYIEWHLKKHSSECLCKSADPSYRWLATVQDRDARIAELEAQLRAANNRVNDLMGGSEWIASHKVS